MEKIVKNHIYCIILEKKYCKSIISNIQDKLRDTDIKLQITQAQNLPQLTPQSFSITKFLSFFNNLPTIFDNNNNKLQLCPPQYILYSPLATSSNKLITTNLIDFPVNTLFIVDEQTEGYGRGNTVWDSQLNSLMFSISLHIYDNKLLCTIQYIICIAVVNALENISQCKTNKIPFRIKWPNDILVNNKKIAGILCTSILTQDPPYRIDIGIGINIFIDNNKKWYSLQDFLNEYNICIDNLCKEKVMYTIVQEFQNIFELFFRYGFKYFEERYYDLWLHSNTIIHVDGYSDSFQIQNISSDTGFLIVKKTTYPFITLEVHPQTSTFDLSSSFIAVKPYKSCN